MLTRIVKREHLIKRSHLFTLIAGEENLKAIVRSAISVIRQTLMYLADDPQKLGGFN